MRISSRRPSSWLDPEDVSEADARDHLVRRYLAAFGPASRKDIATWSHLRPADLAPVLERLQLRRFRDEAGGELLDVPRAPLPDPETPAPVRFLPTWDAVLLVHARRAGVLPEEYRPRSSRRRCRSRSARSSSTARSPGTWRYADGHVRWEPFERLDRATTREVADEAERLAAFHA